MVRPEKVKEAEQLQARLSRASAVILTDFRGLTVAEITALRSRLREAGAEYRVVKNTLLGIAGRSAGITGLDPYLEGPTAAAFTAGDPVPVARVIQEFMRQTRKLALKGCIMDGRVFDEATTRVLADLPGRAELLARVVGRIAAPLAGLQGVLSGVPRALVRVLDQIREEQMAA